MVIVVVMVMVIVMEMVMQSCYLLVFHFSDRLTFRWDTLVATLVAIFGRKIKSLTHDQIPDEVTFERFV